MRSRIPVMTVRTGVWIGNNRQKDRNDLIQIWCYAVEPCEGVS
ncbi:MAG: hypothetical protein ACLU80_10340 [Dorea sp.]